MAIQGGHFIPTTQVWDVSELYSTEVTSPQFKELLVRMYQQLNNMAIAVNGRDAGTYTTEEFVNGQVFYPNPTLTSQSSSSPIQRNVFRKVIKFGALPNAATTSVAHGIPIQAGWTFTRIYGCSSDPVNKSFLPLPYASSVLNENIELWVDGTNVNIKTAVNDSAWTITYVILEYLKN